MNSNPHALRFPCPLSFRKFGLNHSFLKTVEVQSSPPPQFLWIPGALESNILVSGFCIHACCLLWPQTEIQPPSLASTPIQWLNQMYRCARGWGKGLRLCLIKQYRALGLLTISTLSFPFLSQSSPCKLQEGLFLFHTTQCISRIKYPELALGKGLILYPEWLTQVFLPNKYSIPY